eukprot:COSAG01_NODE_3975_length_5476_cov_11.325646_4_plen_75_part_00
MIKLFIHMRDIIHSKSHQRSSANPTDSRLATAVQLARLVTPVYRCHKLHYVRLPQPLREASVIDPIWRVLGSPP